MSEACLYQYGEHVGNTLQLRIPDRVKGRTERAQEEFTHYVGHAVAAECLTIELVDGSHHYIIDLAKMGRRRNTTKQQADLQAVTHIIGAITGLIKPEEYDPHLYVLLGAKPFPDGRLPMLARVRWPNMGDEALSEIATAHMQQAARDLRYAADVKPGLYKKLVYAQVLRQRRVTLETDDLGGCSMDTVEERYHPEQETFEVYAHNLYSPKQQLICLAGAIAIAHAENLVEANKT